MNWLSRHIELDVREHISWRSLKQIAARREVGSEIAEMAVLTGAVVAIGIGVVLAFMNGLGAFFTTLLTRIQQMVP
jgi:hypothetical protein